MIEFLEVSFLSSTLLTYMLAGIATGILSGIFGVGGGIILVPMLIILFKTNPITASGLSLTSLLLPVGILGVYQYFRSGFIQIHHLKFALFIAIGIFFGTYLGARLVAYIPANWLQRAFSVLLIVVAIRLWISSIK
ncbi:MAG: sulfite exporter TauE/SafE family protein [Bdellovibrionales bacterium]|nr:sulfite exporter TauE/SafE family protein [Bdellovibrionales bacterium]